MFPGRLIAAASIARFATVNALPAVPITDPLVLRAKVSVPVGARAAVMLIVPELVPSTAPILTTSATRRLSSAANIDSLPAASVPKSIWVASVRGVTVTMPDDAETEELRAILSAFSNTSPVFEVIDPVFEIEDPKI